MKEILKFNTVKSRLILLAILAFAAWSLSITTEFVGYDDIKLIVRNDRIHKSILYAINFYWNIVSDSHNVAWTNFPTVIFRPLEWVGSSIGYHIWGARAWCFHFFVNFCFHLANSIIFFFILSKVFFTPISNNEELEVKDYNPKQAELKSKAKTKLKKSFKKKENTDKFQGVKSVSWWLPIAIASLWLIHPLHNEAVNMLTSGVGFLAATLCCIAAILINLYTEDITKPRGILLILLAWALAFIGYHGSEMTVIGPFMLTLIFSRSLMKLDFRTYKFELMKIVLSWSTLITYLAHRSSIVSEKREWLANGLGEFFERLCVVAPQIFFHYIKLFFFPAKLTIDQHHNVVLTNAGSPYHLLCFLVALAFVIGIFYFANLKEKEYDLHNKLISASFFFTGFGIAISLNIIPLYVLARDRYTYFFTMGISCLVFLLLDKYYFSKVRERSEEEKKPIYKKLIMVMIIIAIPLCVRSQTRSLDWNNGEVFWNAAIDSVDDLGTKQNWRYRLLQYYKDPGTDTFKADPEKQKKAQEDFDNFPKVGNLTDKKVIEQYVKESIDPSRHIIAKYGYVGNKTIASGLFFNATESLKKKQKREALKLFQAAHYYYPDHFQTNLQLFIHTYGSNEKLSAYLLEKMYKQAQGNSFLAKGLMDGMFFIKHPDTYKYAKVLQTLYPDTQVFNVYAFHGAMKDKNYSEAYRLAKRIIKKYHEQDVFEKFIARYERGLMNSRDASASQAKTANAKS